MKLAWQQIPSTIISELLCQNSLDGLVIDTEHGSFNTETLFACIQVVTLNKKKCFVRLGEINKTSIRICLDAGVDGLIFSTVETLEEARTIQKLCKFPEYEGKRGLGLVRENLWGKKDLIKKPPIIVAQIETIEGVSNIRAISSCEFDYYMIGPYDLSASLGIPGKFNDKKYLEAVKSVRKNIPGKRMAVHIPNNVENELKKYNKYGMICLGMDTTFILEKYEEIEKYA